MKKFLLATAMLAALVNGAIAADTLSFPDTLQGQWCLSSSFKKLPGEPVPHTVCMNISSTELSYNRAEDTVKRLTSLSPNLWRVEFDDGTMATWRLKKKRLMVTIDGKKKPDLWEKLK
jgi:hypothetical protein